MVKKLLFIVVPLVVIGAIAYFAKDFITGALSGKSELKIDSQPTAAVYINGESKGKTPFREKLPTGVYEIKITPEESSLYAFDQKVKLNAGTQTYINFLPAAAEVNSSWDIITLETVKKGETEVTINSSVDASEVFLDGEKKGTTPLAFQNIDEGAHELRISSSGYFDDPIKIKVTSGYKLAIENHLGQTSEKMTEDTQNNTESEQTATGQTVLIKETPTGWLRVRGEPSTVGAEVGRVNPGEKYTLLEEKDGWFQIEYEEGKNGWISGQYAEKTE